MARLASGRTATVGERTHGDRRRRKEAVMSTRACPRGWWRRRRPGGAVLVLAVLAAGVGLLPRASAQPAAPSPDQEQLRGVFKELVEINTTDSVGDNTRAAEAMARHLLAAGFPPADVQVLAPAPRKGNLIARLRGTG